MQLVCLRMCLGLFLEGIEFQWAAYIQINAKAQKLSTGLECVTRHPLLEKLLERDVLEVMLSVIVEVTRGNSQTTAK